MDAHTSDDLQIIEQIGKKFTSVTGQSISFVERGGQWKGTLNLESFTGFCHRVICSEEGKKRCFTCNQVFEKTKDGQIDVGTCHMGVSLLSVPVTIQQKDYLISYGQFLQDETKDEFLEQLEENCKKLGLNPQEMRELAKEFPVLSREELADRIELLKLFSSYVNVTENELQARNQYYREFQEKQELEGRLSLQSLKSQMDSGFMIRSLSAIQKEAEREHAEQTAGLAGDLLHILMLCNELEESGTNAEAVQHLTQELNRVCAAVAHDAAQSPHSEQLDEGNQAVKRAMCILETRYGEELSLTEVARELFLTPGYLSRIFKRETGKNFIEYLTEIRLQQARRLLQEETVTVTAAAGKVGYHDVSYFIRVYKKRFGYTPKAKKS